MIDHHAMAVETGQLCIEKAVHEELRALCQNIVETQSQEIRTMQSWLQDWYGSSHEPQMGPKGMRAMEHLESLSGAEFEIAFMEMMIRHHASAIREGEHCLRKAYHEDLRDLCANIVQTQSHEIETMESWLCEWYGRTCFE